MNLTLEPDTSSHSIWISFDKVTIFNDSTRIVAIINNFATRKIAKIRLGFDHKIENNIDSQIIYDGVYAEPFLNLSEIKPWSKFDVFKLPLYILLFGFLVALLVSIFSFFVRNNEFRKSLFDAFTRSFKDVFFVTGILLPVLGSLVLRKKLKDKTKK